MLKALLVGARTVCPSEIDMLFIARAFLNKETSFIPARIFSPKRLGGTITLSITCMIPLLAPMFASRTGAPLNVVDYEETKTFRGVVINHICFRLRLHFHKFEAKQKPIKGIPFCIALVETSRRVEPINPAFFSVSINPGSMAHTAA